MRITGRSVLSAAAMLIVAASLTACGSSSSENSSSATAPETSSAAPSEAAPSEAAPSEASASDMASADASTDAPASAAAGPDVCAGLPADEVAAIIGTDPGVGTPGDGTCIYLDVSLNLGVAPQEVYDQALESAKSDPDIESIEDLSGMGDRAVFVTQTDGTNAVLAVQGDTVAVAQGAYDKDQLSSLTAALFAAFAA